MTTSNRLLCAAATALMVATPLAMSADKTTLSTGMTYLKGDYGQASDTEILYVPFTLKHRTGPWTLKVTVPYLRITGPGGVLPDLGATGATTPAGTNSGLGDIIAGATYRAYYDAERGLLVNLTGKVKLPTADKNKGLGTGETDWYAESSVYKISGAWTPFATLGYKARIQLQSAQVVGPRGRTPWAALIS